MDNEVKKITKRPFIASLCTKKGYDVKEASEIYELFMDTLIEEILDGNEVTLTGFGNFILKYHKGHKIQFSQKTAIDDYLTLKFTASNILNNRLRALNPELTSKIRQHEALEAEKVKKGSKE